MPGFTSLRGRISTFPALGRAGVAFSAAHSGNAKAASPKRTAAKGVFMGSTAPVIPIVLCDPLSASRRMVSQRKGPLAQTRQAPFVAPSVQQHSHPGRAHEKIVADEQY